MRDREVYGGLAYIQGYSVSPTKNGGRYIGGYLYTMQREYVPFKVWSNAAAFTTLTTADYSGCIMRIQGEAQDYQGTVSLIVNSAVEGNNQGYDVSNFLPKKYNEDALMQGIVDEISVLCTEKGISLANLLLFDNQGVVSRFKMEFAAKTHHDNVLSGLAAHTYKMLKMLTLVLGTYSFATDESEEARNNLVDLFTIGTLLHDVGKIYEMNYGAYTMQSRVTHRVLGMELLFQYRDKIVELYGEEWYYNLISIISQHHGEYGEPCKTVYSYIVHLIDDLDARLTFLSTGIQESAKLDSDIVKIDDLYLTV